MSTVLISLSYLYRQSVRSGESKLKISSNYELSSQSRQIIFLFHCCLEYLAYFLTTLQIILIKLFHIHVHKYKSRLLFITLFISHLSENKLKKSQSFDIFRQMKSLISSIIITYLNFASLQRF